MKDTSLQSRKKPTRQHMTALGWAINMAADWRGSLIGADYDDPESREAETARLSAFDTRLRHARAALNFIRQEMRVAKQTSTER